MVVALGGEKLPLPGIEHTRSIADEPEKCLSLGKEINQLMNQGSGRIAIGFGGNPQDPSAVRGGPAFELIFNIHEHLKKRNLRNHFELNFFAPMSNPGIRLGEKAASEVFRMLDRLSITCHFGKKINSFSENSVCFEDGSKLESDLIVFISARSGHRVLQDSDLPLSAAGFIQIDDHCQVQGFPRVYAVGDSAALQGPELESETRDHLAEIMAKTAAHNIVNQIQKGSGKKNYVDDLSIICLMDTGKGGVFVYRDHRRQWLIPLPVVGHWLKRLWGKYYIQSKLGHVPRLLGM